VSATRTLQVTVKPGARNSLLAQQPDGSWRAELKAPPVDGKANAELIALVAKQFSLRKSQVKIKSGAGARMKRVELSG